MVKKRKWRSGFQGMLTYGLGYDDDDDEGEDDDGDIFGFRYAN